MLQALNILPRDDDLLSLFLMQHDGLRRFSAVGMKRKRALGELQECAAQGYVSPYEIALIYTGLEENDRAFEWLEQAYLERSGWLIYLKVEPMLDRLRVDSRFTELLRRVGFAA
ncbi:MAG: TPR end-of-group domain-containing protein [Blastocatellia bacterium]